MALDTKIVLELDRLPIASALVDQDGAIVQVNPAFNELYRGTLPSEASTDMVLLNGDHLTTPPVGDNRVFRQENGAETPVVIHQSEPDEDGYLLVQITPVCGAGVAEELRRSQQFARNIIDSSLDMIIAVNEQSIITEFNPAACLRFDCEASDMLGKPSSALYAYSEEYDIIQKELVEHGAFAGEITNITAQNEPFTSFIAASRLYDDKGQLIGAMGVSRDITPLRHAQQQSAKLKALFESGSHMFWSVDKRIALTSFNPGYEAMIERIYGKKPEMNTDQSLPRKQFASNEYHKFWGERYEEAFAGNIVRFETNLIDKQGKQVFNDVFLSPVYSADGEVIEVLGVGHEITEKRKSEITVRDQAARLKAIFENSANMMIWTLDTDLRITAFNDHFEQTLKNGMGFTFTLDDHFVERMKERVVEEERGKGEQRYKAAVKGRAQQFETELIDKNGQRAWTETFLNPIIVDGKVKEISCLAHVITGKKEAEVKMKNNLHEKEVLLKEVHHRVKNNLQIISSILNLQTDHVNEDPGMLALLRDSQDRIRSMSYIHESLYRTKNFSSVDLAEYVDGLSRNLMLSYSINGQVELRTDLKEVQLDLDLAVPCGLILNELISNALKHAFPNGRKGVIELQTSVKGDTVSIQVSDNGIGLKNGVEGTPSNLGLQLVETLADQLEGTIECTSDNGVSYLIKFERT